MLATSAAFAARRGRDLAKQYKARRAARRAEGEARSGALAPDIQSQSKRWLSLKAPKPAVLTRPHARLLAYGTPPFQKITCIAIQFPSYNTFLCSKWPALSSGVAPPRRGEVVGYAVLGSPHLGGAGRQAAQALTGRGLALARRRFTRRGLEKTRSRHPKYRAGFLQRG